MSIMATASLTVFVRVRTPSIPLDIFGLVTSALLSICVMRWVKCISPMCSRILSPMKLPVLPEVMTMTRAFSLLFRLFGVSALSLCLGICLLSSQAAAAGLLDVDLDDLAVYSYDSLAPASVEPRASAVTSLFGVTLSKGSNPNDRYINGMLAKDMNFSDFVPVLATMLTEIDAAVQSASFDMSWVGYGPMSWGTLFDYLDRYRLDNQVLQKALGATGTGSALLDFLAQIRTSVAEIGVFVVGYVNLFNDYTKTLFSSLSEFQTDMRSDHAALLAKLTAFDDYFESSPIAFTGFGRWEPQKYTASGYVGYLSQFSTSLNNVLTLPDQVSYLFRDGTVAYTAKGELSRLSIPSLLSAGFQGLAVNLVGADRKSNMSFLVPSADGGLSSQVVSASNLLDAIGIAGTYLQNPLAKLQYVLADDDDIELKDKNKENVEEVIGGFTGSGEGAVSGSQIKDIAGLSGNVKKTFEGAGSIGDVFSVLNDSDNFLFFSQEVADDLDQTNAPAAQSAEDEMEAFMDRFYFDEDGFSHLKDASLWDVSSYLESLG